MVIHVPNGPPKRTQKRKVYLVVLPTGFSNESGEETVVIVGVKLTRRAADKLVEDDPALRVDPWQATKET